MLRIFCFVLCTLGVFGDKFNNNVLLDSEGNVQLFWKVEDDTIIFEVRANTSGYVGIGFSSNGGMKGADIMMAWVVDGTPFISDRHGIGNEEPKVDEQEDYEMLYGSESDGLTTIGYQRKLVTCDVNDYDITTDTIRVIWSYHPDDPEGTSATYHGPQRRGVKSVVFLDVVSSELSELPNGTKSFDVLIDNLLVPGTVTTYWTYHVEIPELATPHHVIRIEPVVQPGNERFIHHLVVKECYGLTNITGDRSVSASDATIMYSACDKLIYAWAIGSGPLEFPENVGYRIAGEDPVKFYQITVHYDNPQLITGVRDNSGVRIHYTANIRQYDSSMLMTGVPSLHQLFPIPPNEEAFPVYGSCNAKCSKELLTEGKMKIFAVFLHAHLAGVGMRLTHYRNGKYVGEISRDADYDFDLQQFRYLKEPWIVQPEDELLVECIYNTKDRTKVTYGGLGTTDEMCLAFIFYYPKANAGRCFSIPRSEALEETLNTGNKTIRESLDELDWTQEESDVVRTWWREGPRMSYCTDHSSQNAFPEDELLEGKNGYMASESLDNLIDIQDEIVEEDQCSSSPSSKGSTGPKGSLFTVFILAILAFV